MSRLPFPTKHELLALIEDRKKDLQRAAPGLHPPGLEPRADSAWRHIRERERSISRQSTRLGMAKSTLEHEFDSNS